MGNPAGQTLVLTARRVVIAFVLAAGVAAGLTALDDWLAVYRSPQWEVVKSYAPSNITYVYGVAFFAWLIGLILCGGPVWHIMHLSDFRNWYHAMLAGFLVPFIVLLAINTGFFTGRASGNWSLYADGGDQWVNGEITSFGWHMALQSSASVGAIGAGLGLLIWSVAYRRGYPPTNPSPL